MIMFGNTATLKAKQNPPCNVFLDILVSSYFRDFGSDGYRFILDSLIFTTYRFVFFLAHLRLVIACIMRLCVALVCPFVQLIPSLFSCLGNNSLAIFI